MCCLLLEERLLVLMRPWSHSQTLPLTGKQHVSYSQRLNKIST